MSQGDHQRKALTIDQIFSYRLRDARLSKQWSQQRLAEAMAASGWPISQQTITRIEAGAHGVGGEIHAQPRRVRPRSVSLGETIAFAVVLGVSPASLFLPLVREDDVQLTPQVRTEPGTAYAWVRGQRPLDPVEGQFYRSQTAFPAPITLEQFATLQGMRVVLEPISKD